MKKISLIVLIGFWTTLVSAQQEAMYTHYSFNTLAVNPAYAGSRDALTLTALHRSQWVGFDGAPITQTFTAHGNLLNNKIGIGLSFANDKIGPLNNTSIYADFAYRLKINEKSKLAFGLKGGVNLLKGDFNSLEVQDAQDPFLTSVSSNDLMPNFGFGVYYSRERFYLGISTPRLLQKEAFVSSNTLNIGKEIRHYYLIVGAIFNLSSNGSLKLKPTTFVKVTDGAPIEADLTALFLIKNKFEIGPMFRTGDAIGLLLGFNPIQQLRVGYSFDWSYANQTFTTNSGSHEIMLRYDIIRNNNNRIKSPRFF